MGERVLIVNADDFGLSAGVNAGVVQAHEQGIVTSASLMVRGPAAIQAAEYARSRPRLAIGLHVDLGEWQHRDGEWRVVYELVAPDDLQATQAEVSGQLEAFRRLVGRDPTHLDSHQHVHLGRAALEVLAALGERLGVYVRDLSDGVRYVGHFYAQNDKGHPNPEAISVEFLLRMIDGLPVGVTELGCHPAALVDFESVYAEERVIELATLCDPRIRAALEAGNVALRSFTELNDVRNKAR
jgi:chitin disaccharide deacetylase